jgi:hypothetical protein
MIRRRDLAIAIAAVVPAAAQVTPTDKPTAEDMIASARAEWKASADKLKTVKIPIGTEPSFIFRP